MKDFMLYNLVTALQDLRLSASRAQAVEIYMDAVQRGEISLAEMPTESPREGTA